MAMMIHYVDQHYKVRTRLIGLRHLQGGHDGKNQAQLLVQILKKYQLEYLVGYLVSDNASNCDSCVDALLHIIHPDMNSIQRIQRRPRCYGHIFNLTAKAFL